MTDGLTPMMRQYRQMKDGLPEGVILLFRLGDFYEMFFEDARIAAPVLEITLTRRNGVPMCGVPFHSVDNYIARLIRDGKKVAIAEQVEDPVAGKGIVRRDVARIVTPGTVTEDLILESDRHNFLSSVCEQGGQWGLALLDVSTGHFCGGQYSSLELLVDEMRRYGPSECLVPDVAQEAMKAQWKGTTAPLFSGCEEWLFAQGTGQDALCRQFGTTSLDGFGLHDKPALICAAGAMVLHLKDLLGRDLRHIRTFQTLNPGDVLVIDEATRANLDLLPIRGRPAGTSLLGILDVTQTPMGARALRDAMLRPLARLPDILARLDAVEAMVTQRRLLSDFRETLGGVRDLERLLSRLMSGTGSPRDMVALGQSLNCLPTVKALLGELQAPLCVTLTGQLVELPELAELIAKAIRDEPSVTLREGGVIREGYHPELDTLYQAGRDGRQWLAEYQAKEQERTGIKTIKVRFNKVFGYYIEISKALADRAPADYIRKQTVTTGERFITPELKEYESKILGANDRAIELEQKIFEEVRMAVVAQSVSIQQTASALASLDMLAALADRAIALRYVRPVINSSDTLRIKDGRHPIVEQLSDAERFVPNDTLLDGTKNQVVLITGPNMAGKSTYIRQVALITIMAQMGSFVPAAELEMGVVDRVFTRVGASDDIARGRSTFMVEMQETSNILNNATPKSLIVLDEIGRGTSTFDGISIAWAVAEHLHNNPKVKAKTLFATHYHELTDLALTLAGVKNYSVQVREKGDAIVFLRKILPGMADKSYGIQVARLAGMPAEVVGRAKEILQNLEEGEFGETGQPKIAKQRVRRPAPGSQLSLFGGE